MKNYLIGTFTRYLDISSDGLIGLVAICKLCQISYYLWYPQETVTAAFTHVFNNTRPNLKPSSKIYSRIINTIWYHIDAQPNVTQHEIYNYQSTINWLNHKLNVKERSRINYLQSIGPKLE